MSQYTKIVLKDVAVSARLGLAQWERERAQRLLVDVELHADPDDYLSSVTTATMIDYRPIYDRIQRWRARAHTDLVETLVSDLLEGCFEDSRVVACSVSIRKPEVLDQAGAAGVQAFMTRRDYECRGAGATRRRNPLQRR